MTMRFINAAFLSLVACTLAMCSQAAEGPANFKVSEFEFTRPVSWEWVDVSTSPMRKAQLKVPNPEQDAGAAEVVFYYFGESGAGGTQANVDRWFGQFQEPKE